MTPVLRTPKAMIGLTNNSPRFRVLAVPWSNFPAREVQVRTWRACHNLSHGQVDWCGYALKPTSLSRRPRNSAPWFILLGLMMTGPWHPTSLFCCTVCDFRFCRGHGSTRLFLANLDKPLDACARRPLTLIMHCYAGSAKSVSESADLDS